VAANVGSSTGADAAAALAKALNTAPAVPAAMNVRRDAWFSVDMEPPLDKPIAFAEMVVSALLLRAVL